MRTRLGSGRLVGSTSCRTGSSGALRDRQFCAPCNGQSASSSPAVRERGIFAHRSASALQSEILLHHRPPILSSLVVSLYLSSVYYSAYFFSIFVFSFLHVRFLFSFVSFILQITSLSVSPRNVFHTIDEHLLRKSTQP